MDAGLWSVLLLGSFLILSQVNFSSAFFKEVTMDKIFTEAAERLNGRLAMIGFVAAVGAYFVTGQVIPGVW